MVKLLFRKPLTKTTAKILPLFLSIFLNVSATAITSEVTTFPPNMVQGTGPLPYNYRIIDKTIHAGGYPLNPANNFGNSDKQTLEILKYLKSQGIKTIIDLENTPWIQNRYQTLINQAGLERIHIPMNINKTPTAKEWEEIKAAMKEPVYIHCKWGADRTGAVIGRYLVEEKGYSSEAAWKAVITGGSHAGPLGGLKTGLPYRSMKLFIQQASARKPR